MDIRAEDKGKSLAELVSDKELSMIPETIDEVRDKQAVEDNVYRIIGSNKTIKYYSFVKDVFETNMQQRVLYVRQGTYSVDGKYIYYPSSHKWKVIGKATVYMSKDFKDFVERFLKKDQEKSKTKPVYSDSTTHLGFGKYKNLSPCEVLVEDENYYNWAVEKGLIIEVVDE